MKKNYVLDACALIATINQEDGYSIVADLYEEAVNGEINIIINKVNLLEVYYGYRRENGKEYADDILKSVIDSIVEISNISIDVLTEAGRLKSKYKLSLADSIAVAESIVNKGSLVTADHHEIEPIEAIENIKVTWFR
jgi:predicted nucleic acid-binding protein